MEIRHRTNALVSEDLEHVLGVTKALWEEIRGRRLFITGGTGFFGCWLLETLLWAEDRLRLGTSVSVLTRDPESFRRKAPHLAGHPAVELVAGDVRSFEFPAGVFSHVVHAATDTDSKLYAEHPDRMLETIVGGTQRVLDFARTHGTTKLLLTSSGAVYGPQPQELALIPEDFDCDPLLEDSLSVYARGKRESERLCVQFAREHPVQVKIARSFAAVGPYLPLDAHFAIGNFVRDALAGGPIRVSGDGTPLRSYLYAADVATWLWTILFSGESNRPYNVGAEEAYSVAKVARIVAEAAGGCEVVVAGVPTGAPPSRYLPSTLRAREELGLGVSVDLPGAAVRTVSFFRSWRNG